MKKIVAFTILLLGLFMYTKKVDAYTSDYQTFAEINLDSGKLMRDWTDEEIKSYYKVTKKRKAFGWKILYVNKNVPCTFYAGTVFSIYNDGTSAITYNFKESEEVSVKRVNTVKGGCSITGKGTNKKLSGGLEASIEASVTETNEHKKTDSIGVSIDIDPGCQLQISYEGKGRLTNGVATKYSVFVRCLNGSFEIFIFTDLFPRIEKTRIR